MTAKRTPLDLEYQNSKVVVIPSLNTLYTVEYAKQGCTSRQASKSGSDIPKYSRLNPATNTPYMLLNRDSICLFSCLFQVSCMNVPALFLAPFRNEPAYQPQLAGFFVETSSRELMHVPQYSGARSAWKCLEAMSSDGFGTIHSFQAYSSILAFSMYIVKSIHFGAYPISTSNEGCFCLLRNKIRMTRLGISPRSDLLQKQALSAFGEKQN